MESKIKLGKEYNFVGYRWIPVKFIDEEKQIVVMQSLGVTVGPWPGYSMLQFGNEKIYNRDIFGEDISEYNKDTKKLMDQIRPVAVDAVAGRGLYLMSTGDIKLVSILNKALASAAQQYDPSCKIAGRYAWSGSLDENRYPWHINISGTQYCYLDQYLSLIVAPAFNLDLSKVAVTGDKIAIIPENTGKGEPEETNFILLLRLLEAFTPVCYGILSNDEIQMIQKYLCIQNRSVISLRNLRDFVVLFLADKADIERRNGNNEKFFQLMDIQSGIVSVIDQQIWNLSGEA